MRGSAHKPGLKSMVSARATSSAPRAMPLDAPRRKEAKNSTSGNLHGAKPAIETKGRGSSTQLVPPDGTKPTGGALSDATNRIRGGRGGPNIARARRATGSSSSLLSSTSLRTSASSKAASKAMAHNGSSKAPDMTGAKDSSRGKKVGIRVLSVAEVAMEAAVTEAAKALGIDIESIDRAAVKAHYAYETNPKLAVEQTVALSKLMNKFNPGTAFKTSSPSSSSLSSPATPQRASQEDKCRGATPYQHDHVTKYSMSSIKTPSAPEWSNSAALSCDEVGPPREVPPQVPSLAGSPQQQQHAPYYPCGRSPPPPDVTPGKNSPGRVKVSPTSIAVAVGFGDDRTTFSASSLHTNPAGSLALSSSNLAFSSMQPLPSLPGATNVKCNKPVLDATFCEAPCGDELSMGLILSGIADVLDDDDDVPPETHHPSPWAFAVHGAP